MRRTAVAVAVSVVILAGLYFWPTDARAIQRTLARAAEAVSSPAGEGDLQRIARTASLAKCLTTDVVVDAGPDGPSVRGRETVVGLVSRLRPAGAAVVEVADVRLLIDGSAKQATADVLVRVAADGRGDVSPFDATELTVNLTKVDGDWLIARVTRIPGLRR
jgi:hypothetical protein